MLSFEVNKDVYIRRSANVLPWFAVFDCFSVRLLSLPFNIL